MDAANFLNDAVSSGGSANPTVDGVAGSEPLGGMMWFNEEYETLVNRAQTLEDTAERTKLYADAKLMFIAHPKILFLKIKRNASKWLS